MPKLKLVFAGTPEFSARHLQAILDSQHQLLAVYTQPDRRAGRGKKLVASAVKKLAEANSLPVYQPASLKPDDQQVQLAELDADLMVVVAYGLILPQSILDTPKLGCINVHASLLPRWRGAAPIERAILAGDEKTGVTIMQMDAGLDTGAMLHSIAVPISHTDDRLSLEAKLSEAGTLALIEALDNFAQIRSKATVQDDSQSTYADKIDKSEALVNWDNTAEMINRVIRVGPGRYPAYSFLDGQRLRILRATVADGKTINSAPSGTIIKADSQSLSVACADSVLQIQTLQFPGKNAMTIGDALNSKANLLKTGARFTAIESAIQ